MKKLLIPVLLISVLFLYGCSSSGSGGDDAPAADYSGLYNITQLFEDRFGEITIVQNGSNAALSYREYDYNITETESGATHTETVSLNDVLTGTGVGKVHGRKIDVTWQSAAFTRLSFSSNGKSFSSTGDVAFSGTRAH